MLGEISFVLDDNFLCIICNDIEVSGMTPMYKQWKNQAHWLELNQCEIRFSKSLLKTNFPLWKPFLMVIGVWNHCICHKKRQGEWGNIFYWTSSCWLWRQAFEFNTELFFRSGQCDLEAMLWGMIFILFSRRLLQDAGLVFRPVCESLVGKVLYRAGRWKED